jgi:hypothetical protein
MKIVVLWIILLFALLQAATWGWVAMTHPHVNIIGAIAIAIAPPLLLAAIAAIELVAIYKKR